MSKDKIPAYRCRQCGACCVALSISTPLPGHSTGKEAGVICANLTSDNRCAVYEKRPAVCRQWQPSILCGQTREEALSLMEELETLTSSGKGI